MELFRNKNVILLPSLLTLTFLSAIYSFPETITAPIVALLYWSFGTLIVFRITRILRVELNNKSKLAKELTQQKQYLENLIELAPEGIVWTGQDQNIKYVNKKFTEIFGYTQQEVKGKSVDQLLTPEPNLSEARKITAAVIHGETRQFEAIRYRKDSTPVHVSIVGAPITSLKGNLEVFGIYRDISQEILAREKLIDSEKNLRLLSNQLMDANNFKELLLDIITHDLRNPAGVIHGALELLEDEFPEHEVLDVIRSSSANLFEVIESASTLSKLSMGEAIDMEDLDLVPILQDVANTFDSQLKSAGMTLTLDLPKTLKIQANRIIGEVFSNYISNGIKYATAGKHLHLTTEQHPNSISIELQDLGTTIPENMHAAIFERKVQLLNGPRHGSGLGLAIVKRIASAHRATAGLKANQPRGNIFYFRFNLPQ